MSPPALPRAALLVALLQAASGCSWAFMQRPPEVVPTPQYPVECTSSKVAPVLDAICAGYFVANGIFWAAEKSCDQASIYESCAESDAKTTGVLLSAGLAVLCAASASSGFTTAGKCQEVKNQNVMCITGDEAACLKLNSTWKPPLQLPAAPASATETNPSPAPPPTTGCTKDVDCKGDRVCERGVCVAPRS